MIVEQEGSEPLPYAKDLSAEQRRWLLDQANLVRKEEANLKQARMKLDALVSGVRRKFPTRFDGWVREEMGWRSGDEVVRASA
jgi:hypothetical protein